MSTRLKITAALRTGQGRGLKGAALERFVKDMAGVGHMTPVECHLASRIFQETVWPITRPPAHSQGRLSIDGPRETAPGPLPPSNTQGAAKRASTASPSVHGGMPRVNK